MNTLNQDRQKGMVNHADLLEKQVTAVDEIDSHFELIKIIKRYEGCFGWTLLIAPDHLPNKDILSRCSVSLDKVLIVHKKHCGDALLVAQQALYQDNCSAVVIWNDMMNAEQIEKLRAKAHANATALYMLPTGNSR